MNDLSSVRVLVEGAQSGQRSAFDHLVDSYSARVRAVASKHLGVQLERGLGVDDVVQETFVRALERIGSFQWKDPERDAFFGWLRGIALNVIRTAATTEKRRGLSTLVGDVRGDSPSGSKILRRNERFDRLQDALARLKPDQREVIEHVRINGRSISEAAELMDRTPNAISILLLRATRDLRELFGDTDSLNLPDRSLFRQGDDEKETD